MQYQYLFVFAVIDSLFYKLKKKKQEEMRWWIDQCVSVGHESRSRFSVKIEQTRR